MPTSLVSATSAADGMNLFAAIEATAAERQARLPGDAIVPDADVVMDRACDIPAPPEAVWPWIVQLGKGRAGWYFPALIERCMPSGRRGLRVIDPRWQHLGTGDVVPDWGGPSARFEVSVLEPPGALVYRSARGPMTMSWAIILTPAEEDATRLQLRLRLGQVRRRWLATSAGELIDKLTIAGMAAGLRERVRARSAPRG
jgi:hypothetical protein